MNDIQKRMLDSLRDLIGSSGTLVFLIYEDYSKMTYGQMGERVKSDELPCIKRHLEACAQKSFESGVAKYDNCLYLKDENVVITCGGNISNFVLVTAMEALRKEFSAKEVIKVN